MILLWFASQNGHLLVVLLILASGRKIDTNTKYIAGTGGWNNKTAEIARFQVTRANPEGESQEEYTRSKMVP